MLGDRRDEEVDMLRSLYDVPCRANSTPCAGQVLEPEAARPIRLERSAF